eukprot:scaffold19102_cov241-Skeletonema_menzelii.AAC.2
MAPVKWLEVVGTTDSLAETLEGCDDVWIINRKFYERQEHQINAINARSISLAKDRERVDTPRLEAQKFAS